MGLALGLWLGPGFCEQHLLGLEVQHLRLLRLQRRVVPRDGLWGGLRVIAPRRARFTHAAHLVRDGVRARVRG